jgi:hypothetical protein
MNYRKETTDYGVTIYSAVQPDYDQELQVRILPNQLVCKVAMHPKPKDDFRPEISKADFAQAFNSATNFFSDFLKI